jgi:hypothetical protein
LLGYSPTVVEVWGSRIEQMSASPFGIDRRELLLLGLGGRLVATAAASDETFEVRARRLLGEYERQGDHRTGTRVDLLSAKWLAREVNRNGLQPGLEAFPLDRIDPIAATLSVKDRRMLGLPLFDGGFTGPEGVAGKLVPLAEAGPGDIALAELRPNSASTGAVGDARRRNSLLGIVCATRLEQPTGLSPSNADSFPSMYGPPVLQVGWEHMAFLQACAKDRENVRLVAQVRRASTEAVNVTARIMGSDPKLAPFLVMTPRSGWYSCGSERGGGIVCWLELMRRIRKPARDVWFVATSGHELGHLGINNYIERRPGIVTRAAGWLHLGANLGAPAGGNIVQASDDEFEAKLTRGLDSRKLKIDVRVPRGRVPSGEAEAVHKGGGRYVSAIGRSAWFHHPGDKGPHVVDIRALSLLADTFEEICNSMVAFPSAPR